MTALIGIVFFSTLAIGVPIAFSMGLTALVSIMALGNIPLHLIPQRLFTGMDSFPIMAVPFFILAGDLMNAAKITDRIVEFSKVLVGKIRGGLGHVGIVGSMFFAGISGSAVADAAALGAILIPAMQRQGYKLAYGGALIAAAAVMGPIIPPSIPMVILALVTNLSVGALFLAGVVPGVGIGIALMVIHVMISKRRGYAKITDTITILHVLRTLWRSIIPLLMPVIILGGILTGVFTATEAAGVAVVYALFVGFFVLRTLKFSDLPRIFFRTCVTTGVILIVMGMANAFSWVLATQQIPQKIGAFLMALSQNPYTILFIINIFLLIVGCFLEGLAAIILLMPILMPLVVQLGVDPLHFGLVVIVNLMIGLLTPPMGMCLFVVCGLTKLPIGAIAKEVVPFFVAEVAVLALVTYLPFLTLALPRAFGLM